MLVFLAFWALLAVALLRPGTRRSLLGRSPGEWAVDGAGLLVQGAGVPLLAYGLGGHLLPRLLPDFDGVLALPPWAGFLVAFVGVDWLYYWNHRLLHGRALWPAHALHHGSPRLDVLATSRNTAWTPLLIVYLWAHAAALYLLREPEGYLLGMALTAALDLWRHCPGLSPRGAAGRLLSRFLVTPALHALHHAAEGARANFGANLSLWDRLHGTWRPAEGPLPAPGIPSALPLGRQFLLPYPGRTA